MTADRRTVPGGHAWQRETPSGSGWRRRRGWRL